MIRMTSLVAASAAALFFIWTANAGAADKKAPKEKPVALTLKVTNLNAKTKPKEAKKLQAALKKVKGVASVKLDKKKGEVVIKHTSAATDEAIKDVIKKAGFTLADAAAPTPAPAEEADTGGDE